MIIDTDSSVVAANLQELESELSAVDAVILLYAMDQPDTFERLSTYWLPAIERSVSPRTDQRLPVMLVAAKRDLDGDSNPRRREDRFLQMTESLLLQFKVRVHEYNHNVH